MKYLCDIFDTSNRHSNALRFKWSIISLLSDWIGLEFESWRYALQSRHLIIIVILAFHWTVDNCIYSSPTKVFKCPKLDAKCCLCERNSGIHCETLIEENRLHTLQIRSFRCEICYYVGLLLIIEQVIELKMYRNNLRSCCVHTCECSHCSARIVTPVDDEDLPSVNDKPSTAIEAQWKMKRWNPMKFPIRWLWCAVVNVLKMMRIHCKFIVQFRFGHN